MGAWTYVAPRLRVATGNMLTVRYVGRPERASPAEGYKAAHEAEQARIVARGAGATTPARDEGAGARRRQRRVEPRMTTQRSRCGFARPRRCLRRSLHARARRAPLHAQERGAAALGEAVRGLGVTTRVLMVGAHPDDEDTQLITWLARGRHVETAYLSLTRGDGGQNLIGNELGEALGVIRTEELLAARRIDGGRQYFTRAYDFGFSKNAEETFAHWPKDSLLGDVVRSCARSGRT